jgi:hypothetical protein
MTIKKPLNHDIVAMSDAQSLYVDDAWFALKMKEKK